MYGHVMMSMWPLLHLLPKCLRAWRKSSMGRNRGQWHLQGRLNPRHLRPRNYRHHWTMESKPPPLPLLGDRSEFRNQHSVWIGSKLKSAVHFGFWGEVRLCVCYVCFCYCILLSICLCSSFLKGGGL